MLKPYAQSLALLTDLYQLTMAYGYWRESLADREAVFHHYFRRAPFGGAFAVAAGLETALQWLGDLRFREDDLEYLASLSGQRGRALFDKAFLDYLARFSFACDVEAVAEGTVVFAQEPLVRVRGPLLHCQLAETALLNIVNFQTLIATKAARVCLAAGDSPVLEFGLRRAQGIDGGISASRAAFIGGCAATSNVLAGKIFGIPVRGTHAHSWVLAFDREPDAFAAYARTMPHNCVLLVDTYDTIEGVRNAVEVGTRLRSLGFRLAGIRIDSGDLAELSIEARKLLDAAGLESTQVVASNDLDEYAIRDLRKRRARVGIWGVGTSIAAAKGDSALGGVYKLSLLKDESGAWQGKAKRSEDPAKASTPGMLQVRRYSTGTGTFSDLIYDELHEPAGQWTGSSADGAVTESEMRGAYEELLKSVLRAGQRVTRPESLVGIQSRCKEQLSSLPGNSSRAKPRGTVRVLVENGLLARRVKLVGRLGGELADRSASTGCG